MTQLLTAIGTSGDLWDFLTTEKWKSLSDQVREEADKEIRKLLKKGLPACTVSGLFEKREKSGLIQHSGYICIDIDGKDHPNISNWEDVITELGYIREVAFSGLSVSGNGAFCIIPIADPSKHTAQYKAIEEDFLRYGIVTDHACKDVTRLRIYSHNATPYINRNAKVYTRIFKPKPIKSNFYSNGDEVEKLVKKIIDTHTNIVPDYPSWFKVGAALANVPNGRELFHAVSRIGAEKYDVKECDKQFDKVKAGAGVSINTLFYYAKNNGITLK